MLGRGIMPIKPVWDERIKKGQEELNKSVVKDVEILRIISECLKEKGIDGEVLLVESIPQNINFEDIMTYYNTNGEGHIIWIEFVKSGHVAVVGAGKDIGFPQNRNKGTWSILSKLSNVEWDKTKVIIIPIRGLDKRSFGLKNVDNLLKCRNGVEHCIGEYLIKNNVPILNYYQHRNYSEKYWNECEKNNYCK